jgi:hypothetical protein
MIAGLGRSRLFVWHSFRLVWLLRFKPIDGISQFKGPPGGMVSRHSGEAPRPCSTILRRKRHQSVMRFVIGSGSSSDPERSQNAAPKVSRRCVPKVDKRPEPQNGTEPCLQSCSELSATADCAAHCALMTLPPYRRSREGKVYQLGRDPKSCWLGLCAKEGSQCGKRGEKKRGGTFCVLDRTPG